MGEPLKSFEQDPSAEISLQSGLLGAERLQDRCVGSRRGEDGGREVGLERDPGARGPGEQPRQAGR